MAAAAAIGDPHGMLSVIGLSDEDLEAICADVRKAMGPESICQLANYLFPQARASAPSVHERKGDERVDVRMAASPVPCCIHI